MIYLFSTQDYILDVFFVLIRRGGNLYLLNQ